MSGPHVFLLLRRMGSNRRHGPHIKTKDRAAWRETTLSSVSGVCIARLGNVKSLAQKKAMNERSPVIPRSYIGHPRRGDENSTAGPWLDSRHTGLRLRVDLDPVAAYFRCYLFAVPIKNDEGGLLLCHVTLNAIAGDIMILWEPRALRFVTVEALSRKLCEIVLHGVDLVAGETSHRS